MRTAIGVLLVALATGCQRDPQPARSSAPSNERETREVRALPTPTPATWRARAAQPSGLGEICGDW